MTHATTNIITQDQFAQALIAKLDMSTVDVSADISERLRFARQRAVDHQKQTQINIAVQTAPAWQAQPSGSLAMGGGSGNGFDRFNFDLLSKWGSLLPLLALVAGLFAISHIQTELRAKEVADIDSALLTDDLPPAAYADHGFGQFLKLQLNSEGLE